MTYNKEKILSALNTNVLNINNDFHEGNNDDLLLAIGNNLFDGLYHHNHGVSKIALIPDNDDIDFVIKIPYTGSYNYNSGYYSGSKNQYYHRGYEDYYPFESGTYDERPWDYCAIEVQRYAEASLEGFADCLAETKLLGFINNYPIYIQEKCITLSSSVSTHTHSRGERLYTRTICNWGGLPCDWMTDFRLYFGENKLRKFIQFLKNRNWDDLRDENIGYIKNKPVLIDYSNFLE